MTEQLKPFHESVVDAINRAHMSDLDALACLLKETAIPKNHDAIAVAWTQRCAEFGTSSDFAVPDSIMEQKKAAEDKDEAA